MKIVAQNFLYISMQVNKGDLGATKKDWVGIYSLHERVIYLAIESTSLTAKLTCQLSDPRTFGELSKLEKFCQILHLRQQFYCASYQICIV